jgi:hypothetical protein
MAIRPYYNLFQIHGWLKMLVRALFFGVFGGICG